MKSILKDFLKAMIENKHLHAGKVMYKFYHGYNINPLLEMMKQFNYTFSTLYQSSGLFRLWFVNNFNPAKRMMITEYPRYKNLEISLFIIDEETGFSKKKAFRNIDNYWQTSVIDGLHYINMQAILENYQAVEEEINKKQCEPGTITL